MYTFRLLLLFSCSLSVLIKEFTYSLSRGIITFVSVKLLGSSFKASSCLKKYPTELATAVEMECVRPHLFHCFVFEILVCAIYQGVVCGYYDAYFSTRSAVCVIV